MQLYTSNLSLVLLDFDVIVSAAAAFELAAAAAAVAATACCYFYFSFANYSELVVIKKPPSESRPHQLLSGDGDGPPRLLRLAPTDLPPHRGVPRSGADLPGGGGAAVRARGGPEGGPDPGGRQPARGRPEPGV